MKKLANVSPFILLLVPVIIMFLVAVSTTGNKRQTEEFAMKQQTSTQTGSIIKLIPALLK